MFRPPLLLCAALATACAATISAGSTSAAPAQHAKAGRVAAKPPASVHRPATPPKAKVAAPARPEAKSSVRPGSRPVQPPRGNYRPGRPDNVVAGNTVVVAPGRPSNGYYDGGRYYPPRDWYDDDDDFLEFVGKTAAVTAGVGAVTAIIGSIVQDKPSDDCRETISDGQTYLNCNGVWYAAVAPTGSTQPQYQVVAPPAETPAP
jgi:hypothetical protein